MRRSNDDTHFGRLPGVSILVRTDAQLRQHEGFKPEEIHLHSHRSVVADADPDQLLARPYPWAQRDDLLCLNRWANGKDEWDVTGHRASDKGKARALCAGCPVTEECLSSALEEERGMGAQYRHLVRGGTTPLERWKQEMSNRQASLPKTVRSDAPGSHDGSCTT